MQVPAVSPCSEKRCEGRRAERRGLASLCLPPWSPGLGSKAET